MAGSRPIMSYISADNMHDIDNFMASLHRRTARAVVLHQQQSNSHMNLRYIARRLNSLDLENLNLPAISHLGNIDTIDSSDTIDSFGIIDNIDNIGTRGSDIGADLLVGGNCNNEHNTSDLLDSDHNNDNFANHSNNYDCQHCARVYTAPVGVSGNRCESALLVDDSCYYSYSHNHKQRSSANNNDDARANDDLMIKVNETNNQNTNRNTQNNRSIQARPIIATNNYHYKQKQQDLLLSEHMFSSGQTPSDQHHYDHHHHSHHQHQHQHHHEQHHEDHEDAAKETTRDTTREARNRRYRRRNKHIQQRPRISGQQSSVYHVTGRAVPDSMGRNDQQQYQQQQYQQQQQHYRQQYHQDQDNFDTGLEHVQTSPDHPERKHRSRIGHKIREQHEQQEKEATIRMREKEKNSTSDNYILHSSTDDYHSDSTEVQSNLRPSYNNNRQQQQLSHKHNIVRSHKPQVKKPNQQGNHHDLIIDSSIETSKLSSPIQQQHHQQQQQQQQQQQRHPLTSGGELVSDNSDTNNYMSRHKQEHLVNKSSNQLDMTNRYTGTQLTARGATPLTSNNEIDKQRNDDSDILFVDTGNYKHSPFGLRHHLSLPGAVVTASAINGGSTVLSQRQGQLHNRYLSGNKLHNVVNGVDQLQQPLTTANNSINRTFKGPVSQHSNDLSTHSSTSYLIQQQNKNSLGATATAATTTTTTTTAASSTSSGEVANGLLKPAHTAMSSQVDWSSSSGFNQQQRQQQQQQHQYQNRSSSQQFHHQHNKQTNNIDQQQQQQQAQASHVLVKFCSIVYAMFLVILGCILHISELKKKTQNSIDHIYSSLVAVIGMLWLAFLHVDLQRYKRFASRFLLLDSILDPNGTNNTSSDRMSLNTEVIFKRSAQLQSRYNQHLASTTAQTISRSSPLNRHLDSQSFQRLASNSKSTQLSSSTNHLDCQADDVYPVQQLNHQLNVTNFVPAYKFLRGKIGAGFYLKCGMAAFCFGHVVHEGLHFGQHIYFLVTDNGRCQDIPALVAHLITPLYSFYQLFIMFKYSNLVINRYKGFAYFGLMHVIGTSISFWFRTIIEEAFDDFITKMDYFKQHHSGPYNDHQRNSHKFYANSTTNNIIPSIAANNSADRLLTSDTHYDTNYNTNSTGQHEHTHNHHGAANHAAANHNGAHHSVGQHNGPTNNNHHVKFDQSGDGHSNATMQSSDPLLSSSANSYAHNNHNQHQSYNNRDTSASNISQHIIALMSPHLSVIAPQLAATLPESYACSQNSLLTTKSMNALPYLYPFTIEYNLLIAATFLELYFNVGKMSTNAYNNPYRREIKQNCDGIEEFEYKSNFVVSADCHAANRGLFCGFFTLLVTLVSIVIFFVSMSKPGHHELGIKINLIQETVLVLLILVIATLAFMQTSRLNKNPCIRDQITTNDTLMLIPLPFFFTHSLLSVKAEYGTVTTPLREVSLFKWIAIIINLITVIEVLVQTSFIVDGLRRCSQSRYLRFKKPGRELLTFCIILNLTLWIVSTFESKSVEQYHVEIEYYGPLSWMFVSHTTLPVMLFYRYHSSVCLAEIWGRAYKAAKSY